MIRRMLYIIISGFWRSNAKTNHRLPNKIWLILGFSLILLIWQSASDVFAATPCLLCHPAIAPNTETQVTEWNSSGHAHSLETLKDSLDAEDACLKCHTADYVFDQNITLDKAESNNDCAVCHADHKGMEKVFSGIGRDLLKPKAEVCNECHSAGGAIPGEKPRSTQVEIFAGIGGAGVSDSPGVHYALMKDNDGCATCHLFKEKEDEVSEVGGHTFKANTAACLKCHTDPAVAEKKKADAQKQISDQLSGLKPLLETFADKESEDFKNAEYDINLVEISGDLGVHNLTYSKKLLDYSASVLKGGEKPKVEEPCLLCHNALSATQVAEWGQSEHANSLETLLASPDAKDECLQCHSVDYQLDPANVTLETAELPNGCGSCHADHKGIEKVFSGIGKDLLKPASELCNNCHTAGDVKPGEIPPASQREIFIGTGGVGVADSPGVHYTLIKDSCVKCHKERESGISDVGGHTFKANLAVCLECHKEPEKKRDEAHQQILEKLSELEPLIEAFEDKGSEEFQNAKFNVDLVRISGDYGVHNLTYSNKLLDYSLSILKGEGPGEKPKAEEPCLLCHKSLSTEQVAGWEQSKHAKSLETLLASSDAEDACLQCHSVDYRNDPANVTLETAQLPNGCGSCHADHKGIEKVFSGIGKNLLNPKNEVCNDCHTAGDATPGDTLQAAQVEIFSGTGGIGVPDSPSIHFSIHEPKEGCVYCHTPSMTSETGEEISHTFEANLAVCSTCHKEPTATLTQAQEQISTELAELTKLLDEHTDKESDNFKNAKFNVDLVSLGESGAHNLKYSISLLEYSKSLLEAPVVEFPAYDVNKDGVVDIADIDIVSAHFGETVVHEKVMADSPTPNPDVDGSGTVDISDLTLIGIHFGEITAPAAAPAIAATDDADE